MSATSSTSSVFVSDNPSLTQSFTLHLKSDQRINHIKFSELLRLGDLKQLTRGEIAALQEEQSELNENELTLPLKIFKRRCFEGWAISSCLHKERNDHSISCTLTFTGVGLSAYTAQIPLISEIARESIYKNDPSVILKRGHHRSRHRIHRNKTNENPFYAIVKRAHAHHRRHRSRSSSSSSSSLSEE